MQDDTAVHLQLRLTRAAKSYGAFTATSATATSLTFQVSPQALQARQHVAMLRQFHLRLRLGRLGTHGEDVKDEAGAVEYLHAQLLLDVAHLLGAELIVEDNHADRLRGYGGSRVRRYEITFCLLCILVPPYLRTSVPPTILYTLIVCILLLLDICTDFL